MDFHELRVRHISVGGNTGQLEIEAYVLGVLLPDPFQHNLITQAINKHFMDHGGNHPVAYDDSGM